MPIEVKCKYCKEELKTGETFYYLIGGILDKIEGMMMDFSKEEYICNKCLNKLEGRLK